MSVVNKVEKTYLDILRIVVLAVASILLILAIVTGIIGFSGTFGSGDGNVSPKKVVPEDVIQEMVPASENKSEMPKSANSNKKADDPFKEQYRKIAEAISLFVKTYGAGIESVDNDKVIAFVSGRTDSIKEDDAKERFITGLEETVEKGLKSEIVISRVKKDPSAKKIDPPAAEPVLLGMDENGQPVYAPVSPIAESPFKESPTEIAMQLVNLYEDNFNKKIDEASEQELKNKMAKAENSAKATMQLYIAGGAFLAFILVIFVSVLVKIERNLRVMSEKP